MSRRLYSSTLDVRISVAQDEALRWYAKQVPCSVAELVRATLPSSIPSPRGGPDVDDQVEAYREAVIAAHLERRGEEA